MYKGLGVLWYQQWINMWWLGFRAKLSASWSAVAFQQSGTYTPPPIHFLLFLCQGGQRGVGGGWSVVGGEQSCFRRLLDEISACFLSCFCLHTTESQGLFACAHATSILATAIIWEQRLIESGVWSSEYSTRKDVLLKEKRSNRC